MLRATPIFVLILLYLALQFVTGPGGGSPGALAPAGGTTLQEAGATAQTLAQTTIPLNDVYKLTEALRLHSTAPLSHIARTTPLGKHVGDVDVFNLARFREKDFVPLTATVRLVTGHAYWYVQNGYDVDLSALQASAQAFENKIYPTDHEYFGTEWSPGIDGDPRITILTADIPGVGGYFANSDEYVRAVNQYSNQREMIYIAAKPGGMSGQYNFYEGVLAHELQHMIHWNVQRDRDIWIDEGCAETAMALNGYDLAGTEPAFLSRPDTQLTAWSQDSDPTNYGAAYLFIRYAMQHYGGADFLRALLASPGTGAEAVTGALQRRGYQVTFEDVFKDWVVANYVKDSSVGDGRYGYDVLPTRAAVDRRVVRYPTTVNATVHQYAADYISLERGAGDTTIDFQGGVTSPLVPTQAHSGHEFWYSNRRDAGDMTLTRAFDLRGVPHATLNFWTWYQIEEDFDYGYVEVSTDNGQTWTTQPGHYTTDTSPNGANYGHGYTGASGRPPKSTAAPQWVQESVDLSAYTGQQVLVRFEYVTDEGFNAPSWAVDDISVPEIGYQSDVESDDGGWQAAGWVRVANAVPQHWFVAAIEYGSGAQAVQVQSLTLDAQDHGTLTVPGFGSQVRQVVLVVAALAPTTTEVAPYRVSVQRTP